MLFSWLHSILIFAQMEFIKWIRIHSCGTCIKCHSKWQNEVLREYLPFFLCCVFYRVHNSNMKWIVVVSWCFVFVLFLSFSFSVSLNTHCVHFDSKHCRRVYFYFTIFFPFPLCKVWNLKTLIYGFVYVALQQLRVRRERKKKTRHLFISMENIV